MEQQNFGPLELPSGKKITFREPIGADRVNVVQMLKMSLDNMASGALLIDNYVAAKCVATIDSKTVDQADYKRLFDNMSDEDVTFYQTVFQEMFGMNDEKRNNAKEAARFLRQGQTSIASSK
ncbi:hypothetical protein [Pelosinus sp. IPA-1]|uniref:hypothetical protein n=1 Tax=Pelosinus sp. IPA-1 TaxID=3029569 RepID=UPI0024362110|nr:hypothetical protein [Pelosinus sp. IPA-1]GMB00220.1 hypothetical protein PIPA1_30190 [Pelosinus sp. IPA-1]